jgi:hypothetical protein
MRFAAGVLLLFSLCRPSLSIAASSEENAAVKYLRADAALRQSYSLPTDGAAKLMLAMESPLNNDDEQLSASAGEALTEFGHGAARKFCDWTMSTEDGPFANTAHRGAVMEMAAVSAIRARLRFRDGDLPGAGADITIAMAAARHLSLDGSLASVLFAYSLENKLSGILSQNLYLFSSAQLISLEKRIEELPNGSNLKSAFEAEKLHRDDLTPIVQGVRTRDELIGRLLQGIPALQANRQLAMEIVDGCGGSVSGFMHCIKQQQTFYVTWESRFNLPLQEFEAEYRAELAALAKTNSIVRLLTPDLPRFRWTEAYTATRRALLRAAIATRKDGRAGADRFPDPYDGKPFSYESVDGGFRLESHLKDGNAPISLTILSNPKGK